MCNYSDKELQRKTFFQFFAAQQGENVIELFDETQFAV